MINNQISRSTQNALAQHPLQSWEWGEARSSMGIRVIKIHTEKDIFQMTIHPIPYSPFFIGYIPRSNLPNTKTIIEIVQNAKKHNCIFVKIEPYIFYKEAIDWYKKISTDISIQQSTHPLFPEWTQMLDLHSSEEELLTKMKSKTRYNIKLAEKKEVIVKEESHDDGFRIFSKLYFETCTRQKYRGHTPAYHTNVWNNLKNSIAHILTAYYHLKPLASYQLFFFQKKLYYLYGGSSTQEKHRMAANLLMWRAIQLGKKLGATIFDMWGSLSPEYDRTNTWAGFTRFKEGYGTSFVRLSPSWDFVIHRPLYLLYSLFYKARSQLLRYF